MKHQTQTRSAAIGLILILLWLSGCSNTPETPDYAPTVHESDKAADINLQLGIEYMRRKQYDIALSRLKRALEIDSNYAEVHNAIAVLYQRVGEYALAGKHYSRAVELSPGNADIHNNYGQFLCEKGDWRAAEQQFMKAVENPVYRTPHIPYTNAAICAIRFKHLEKAETWLRQVLSQQPEFPLALYHMAALEYENGRYQDASKYLKRYLELSEHNAQTLWLSIRIERALHNPDAAASYAMLLRARYPDSPQTQLLNQSEQ